jgi:transcriptional regulator with XRE-family HTH domain
MKLTASKALQRARMAAGWSQRELATRASVAQPAIARIESGTVVPRFDTLQHLLNICGRSLETVPAPGAGLDRSVIRELLAMTPRQRLDMAVEDASNLARLLQSRAPS